MKVGNKIKIARNMKAPKISMKELADVLGVSYQQVQKYENGINRVSADDLPKIAEFLGVGVSFFYDENYKHIQDTDTAQLVALINNIKDKKTAIRILKVL